MCVKDLKGWFERVTGLDIRVLAIGGSDPGGGAGIQQDLRTITVLGAYGTAIPTALTIQNTTGVKAIVPVEPEVLQRQVNNCMGDIAFDAVKLGMLATSSNLRALERVFSAAPPRHLVVDPVVSSKNEKQLLEGKAVPEFLKRIARFSTVITPNIPEACALLGVNPQKNISQEELAQALFDRASLHSHGPVAIIVKGGHGKLHEGVVDVVADKEGIATVEGPRVQTRHTHGTGCAYASCLATLLGGGVELRAAMKICREFMDYSLTASKQIGKGIGPVNTLFIQKRELERENILKALSRASHVLEAREGAGRLAPEIQINLGYALPFARSRMDVAAFPGRIVRVETRLVKVRPPKFGASQHVANIILTAMSYDPSMRSAMDIRLDREFLKRAKEHGLRVASFSRKDEPKDVKEKEGSSLVWGVKKAIEECGGKVPDLIWDRGDIGKEPAIRVLGQTPMEVVEKALDLLP